MNRTINISLNGMNFTLDESAYQKLELYLNQIRDSLSHEEGKEEIMVDVEARIAELFKQDLGISREVINDRDVDKMVDVMGRPEDYLGEETENIDDNAYSSQRTTYTGAIHKKLYRDPDNKIIGGVLAGISHYFGWDPTWIRIGYVALPLISMFIDAGSMVGFFTISYILLWIVVPLAQTNLQKMEMYGEPKTVDNIRRNVTSNDLNSKLNEVGDFTKEVAHDARPYIEQLFSSLWRIFKVFVGIWLLFISIVLLVSTFIIIGTMLFSNTEIMQFGNLIFDHSWQYYVASILAVLGMLAIAVMMFYAGLRLTFSNKLFKNGAQVVLTCLGVFIVSAIGLTLILVNVGMNFRDNVSYNQTVPLNVQSDTLQVQFRKDQNGTLKYSNNAFSTSLRSSINLDSIYYPISQNIELEKSSDNNFHLEIEYSSKGKNVQDARDNIQKVIYNFDLEGDTLDLDSYFTMTDDAKFRNQKVNFKIYVPENKWIKAKEMNSIYNHRDNFNIYLDDEPNREVRLLMQKDNIKCLNCSEDEYSLDNDHYNYKDKDVSIRANEDSVSIETPDVKMKIENK